MAAPARSDAEARANATYEALMWALARPGLPRTLPDASDAVIVEALIDRECAVHCADAALAEIVAQTGAALVAPDVADHLFLGDMGGGSATTQDGAAPLRAVRCGSDLYPDDGATVVIHARIGSGPQVRLTGPGVDGSVDVALDGLPSGIWEIRQQMLRYPMGFELVLRDGAQIIGLPRSTVVEVL